MKIDFVKSGCSVGLLALLALATATAACRQSTPQSADKPTPELELARAENQEVQKLRRENQELSRLREDHEEVTRLRREIDQLPALRQENEQLKSQLTRGPRQGAQPPSVGTVPPGLPNSQLTAMGNAALATNQLEVNPADLPQEGDEILVAPKMLSKLLPGFDWEKVERKEPVAIRSLLEQQGIIITNYQQLAEYGITNYVIQRNPVAPEEAK